ncbi:CPBP family intramembrane metalloprotease [Alcaligenaceae bacterium CGII-47]|nr:CPBP family intramembrane metalloprotease [Alcaligenaceae bacterium CGII-47]
MHHAAVPDTRFWREFTDFMRFVWRPRPGPRLPGRHARPGVLEDFLPRLSAWRLLQWALLLWVINLFIFGPLAVSVAQAGGAQHRLNLHSLPWLQALIWAPIVEEMAFRFCLRRVAMLWWFVPLMVIILVFGPGVATILLLMIALYLCWMPLWVASAYRLTWAQRVRVRRYYPWLYHLSAIAFAAVHLYNFRLHEMPWLLMPFLVLPQWATGLVLGWIRVRRGIGASILLHSIFNAGPLLVVLLILNFAPSLTALG